MTNADLSAFEHQLSLLSYTEQLSIIEFLVNLLKNKREEATYEKTETASQKIFSLMDAHPVYSNGEKWSREELYER